jgi:cephalosporin-C deacetylase-like acetyl esterase
MPAAEASSVMPSFFRCLLAILGIQGAVLSGVAAERALTRAQWEAQTQTEMESFLKAEAVRLDAQFLEGITNRAQWEAGRETRRQRYFEMLGLWPLPERTALQAQVTGQLEQSNVRIEKVHFQSRPGLYVTGNLYRPAQIPKETQLPAVLYVCGHSGRGRDGNKVAFQHHGMWFATHGYVCLIIDTLQLGEIGATHHGTYRLDRWWWQARGYSPAGVECWNGIRALDYLQSRPEVDRDRLAVTGISGGGAASFWIAAADERVKVAVPVSGMSDLEDYVGDKVVNGHCDCMFLINTFQWPWTQIAALVAPRPMLFANSGHDTIFPMTGNDRIRARLERLYGFYTNRTERLFDIAVTPGGHDDNPELRLMAYRWINHHLKGEDGPVTEPDLPKIDGASLRAFPDALPADEINTRIDELFVPAATNRLPATAAEFKEWRARKIQELLRVVFRPTLPPRDPRPALNLNRRKLSTGQVPSEAGVNVAWRFFPARSERPERPSWLVVLDEGESLEVKPSWLGRVCTNEAVLLVAPRGAGPGRSADPPPYYLQRSLPLLGRTLDSCRLLDVQAVVQCLPITKGRQGARGGTWNVTGRGTAGVLAAYAALFDERVSEVVLVDPPSSHRNGPFFLNVLRVLDIPEAFGLLAPRSLTVRTSAPGMFETTAALYRLTGANYRPEPLP